MRKCLHLFRARQYIPTISPAVEPVSNTRVTRTGSTPDAWTNVTSVPLSMRTRMSPGVPMYSALGTTCRSTPSLGRTSKALVMGESSRTACPWNLSVTVQSSSGNSPTITNKDHANPKRAMCETAIHNSSAKPMAHVDHPHPPSTNTQRAQFSPRRACSLNVAEFWRAHRGRRWPRGALSTVCLVSAGSVRIYAG